MGARSKVPPSVVRVGTGLSFVNLSRIRGSACAISDSRIRVRRGANCGVAGGVTIEAFGPEWALDDFTRGLAAGVALALWLAKVGGVVEIRVGEYGIDTPAGGGAGMVLKPDVLAAAIDSVADTRPILAMTPRGAPLTEGAGHRGMADAVDGLDAVDHIGRTFEQSLQAVCFLAVADSPRGEALAVSRAG